MSGSNLIEGIWCG